MATKSVSLRRKKRYTTRKAERRNALATQRIFPSLQADFSFGQGRRCVGPFKRGSVPANE
jgi:hypothetical protein